MPKLIVLSNRVNLPSCHASKPLAGGLAVALHEALTEYGGVWVGWNGEVLSTDADIANHQTNPVFNNVQYDKVTYVTTPFSPLQYEKYYCGYANNRLWAGLHDRTDLIASSSEDFKAYQDVNAMFAKALHKLAEPDDIIWVQDYHFFGVATHCRALGMQQRIGFFLHIPFPKLFVWQYLTYGQALVRQLADYDVVGLQTAQDKDNCVAVMQQLLPASTKVASSLGGTLLTCEGYHTLIKTYPIGINPGHISELASKPNDSQVLPDKLKPDLITVIAVERLDYTKGIPERLQAFGLFLQRYPHYIGKIQLYQIACPSRLDIQAYQQLQTTVHMLVKQINDAFATSDWQPVVYQEEPIGHDDVMPLLRRCEICWVNSLKDGMNLVAKEYVAAQDPQSAGVLILSKNTGAVQQLQHAIIVDPHDEDSLVSGLYQALTLTPHERRQRHQALLTNLYEQDINQWRDNFLADLSYCHAKNRIKDKNKDKTIIANTFV